MLPVVFSRLLFCPPASAVSEPVCLVVELRVAAASRLAELPASAQARDSALDGSVVPRAADFPEVDSSLAGYSEPVRDAPALPLDGLLPDDCSARLTAEWAGPAVDSSPVDCSEPVRGALATRLADSSQGDWPVAKQVADWVEQRVYSSRPPADDWFRLLVDGLVEWRVVCSVEAGWRAGVHWHSRAAVRGDSQAVPLVVQTSRHSSDVR